jgi:hypothetical protein
MAKQTINLGTADKGNGDPLRTAFNKVNENFTELYTLVGVASLTELAQDYAAQMLVNGNHEGATVEYDDVNNKLNIIVAQDYDGGAASTIYDDETLLDGGGA